MKTMTDEEKKEAKDLRKYISLSEHQINSMLADLKDFGDTTIGVAVFTQTAILIKESVKDGSSVPGENGETLEAIGQRMLLHLGGLGFSMVGRSRLTDELLKLEGEFDESLDEGPEEQREAEGEVEEGSSHEKGQRGEEKEGGLR